MREMRMRNKIQHSFKSTVSLRQGFNGAISLFLRRQQQPTTSQPHPRSCSSGTGFGWISIRGQTLQVWRRRSNNTQKTTRETARTRTFQRDTWVDKTSLLKVFSCTSPGLDMKFYKLSIQHFRNGLFHYLASLGVKVFPSSVECKEWCLTEKRQENTAFVMKLETEKPISAKCINVSQGVASEGHVCTLFEC